MIEKEIGMEKLIELLNECTNGRFKTEQDLRLCIEMKGYCRDFCKWLVENDKIDLEKVKINWLNYVNDEILENKILMLLSISDTPIEDLISYLK